MPIPRRPASSWPLSFVQQRLWLLHQLDPRAAAQGIAAGLHLQGPLRVAALRRGLQTIQSRHQVLRVRYQNHQGEPLLRVAPGPAAALPVIDLGQLPAAARQAQVRRIVRRLAAEPFDLQHGPLWRAALLRTGAADHVLLLHVHRIAFDRRSWGIFCRELAALYDCFAAGRPSPLAELPLQFGDFAAWQRDRLAGERRERQLAFWRELHAQAVTLQLPTSRRRPEVQAQRGERYRLALAAPAVGALARQGRRAGATLSMTLLAAWSALLARAGAGDRLVVGIPVANRDRVETRGLLGPFADHLAVRIECGGDPSLRELLGRVRQASLAAGEHRELPFALLVEALQHERDESRTPVFQVLFSLERAAPAAPATPAAAAGVAFRPLAIAPGTAQFDLALELFAGGGTIEGWIEHNADLFSAAACGRLAMQYAALLEGFAAAPECRLSDVALLDPAQRQQLLREWTDSPGERPALDVSLRFRAQVAERPDAPALTSWRDGQVERLTYAELGARAFDLAARLRRLGVGPETRVALCLERSAEMVWSILAVMEAGGAYVPFSPADPPQRFAQLLRECGARVLITQPALAARLPSQGCAVVVVGGTPAPAAGAGAGARPAANRPARRQPPPPASFAADSVAYVIHTSGSTGRPKGVEVTRGNLAWLFTADAGELAMGPGDVWAMFFSYAFDFAQWEVWGALAQGGRLVVAPEQVRTAPGALAELLVSERVTVLNQTPTAFGQMALGPLRRGALRLIVLGGEAVDIGSLAWWFDGCGSPEAGAPRLYNLYGITETTVHSTLRLLRRADLAAPYGSWIGRPLCDLEIHVLDRRQQPVPIGVPGELYVAGPAVARGYRGRPDLTAERFIPHATSRKAGERLYRSGDLGRLLPNGELDYLGRIDRQVKVRGHRVELGEIEAALLRHPRVRQAAVVVWRPAPTDMRLVAWVAAVDGAPLPAWELREHLAALLPEPMVPADYAQLPALPVTTSGKIDRRALPAWEGRRPQLATPFEPPRGELEQSLAALWSEHLQVPRVGIHDSYFELGGNSISLVKLHARLEEVLRQPIPLMTLFRFPTIAGLAGHLRHDESRAPGDAPVAKRASERAQVRQERTQQRRRAGAASSSGVSGSSGSSGVSGSSRAARLDPTRGNDPERGAP